MDAPVSPLPVVESVNDAVRRLGGRQAVAKLFEKLTDNAVANWCAWDALPQRLTVYRTMTRAARDAGFVIPDHLFRPPVTRSGEGGAREDSAA